MGKPYKGHPRHRGEPGQPSCSFGKGCSKSQKEAGRDEEKKEEEEEEDEDDDMSSSSKSNVNYRKGKKKMSRPGGALEKVPESALGKADSTIRRGRGAKHGQKELLLEESPLEKGQKNNARTR